MGVLLLLFIQLWICTRFFFIVLGRFLTLCMKLYCKLCYSLFERSGKVLPVTLTSLFFLFILYIPTRLFWVAQTKHHLNVKSPQGGSAYCLLKAPKVLLMHLFIALLINKIPGSNNQHFLFNILKNENQEEFLTCGTFCTFELIEENLLQKRLSQDALSKFYLNKYGSYLKFILLLSSDINMNPGPTTPKRNDMLWELLLFHSCSFLLRGWIISWILYLRLAIMHGIYFKIERCSSFI